MHPTARIGFHAPQLDVAGEGFDASAVREAFDLGVEAIARLAHMDERSSLGRPVQFPRSLLAEMLSYRGGDYLWLDTVEKASAWGIDLATTAAVSPSEAMMVQLCPSATRWINDEPHLDDEMDLGSQMGWASRTDDRWDVTMASMIDHSCTVAWTGWGYRIEVNFDGVEASTVVQSWQLLPPNTRLEDLR